MLNDYDNWYLLFASWQIEMGNLVWLHEAVKFANVLLLTVSVCAWAVTNGNLPERCKYFHLISIHVLGKLQTVFAMR